MDERPSCVVENLCEVAIPEAFPEKPKNLRATNGDTGRATDLITKADKEIDLNKVEENDEMVIQEHLSTVETRAVETDATQNEKVEPATRIGDSHGTFLDKEDVVMSIEQEIDDVDAEMENEQYEPLGGGKELGSINQTLVRRIYYLREQLLQPSITARLHHTTYE
ncbi:hypothetical protein RND71_032066 [Anisodus tanguticus]|uniref:Uncharacterized protein n=1 Tax=Anisodus tanguticus TaxID=243964 RepID=A0AAE1RDV4_9SOLA|nr:hypothetical protein RND71_032066 [Anisodus tanguticus]